VDAQRRTSGISLAKGPVGLLGLAVLTYGVTAVIFGSHNFALHAPNGAVHGSTWLGLEVNGWSSALFIAAGLLLLLSAPAHWSAKFMSLVIGVALGAGALVSVIKGHGVLGIFAANGLTELVWGAAAAVLMLVSLLPRVGGRTERHSDPGLVQQRADPGPSTTVHEPPVEPAVPVDPDSSSSNGARTRTQAGSTDTASAAPALTP
jgi:hypothetical protein